MITSHPLSGIPYALCTTPSWEGWCSVNGVRSWVVCAWGALLLFSEERHGTSDSGIDLFGQHPAVRGSVVMLLLGDGSQVEIDTDSDLPRILSRTVPYISSPTPYLAVARRLQEPPSTSLRVLVPGLHASSELAELCRLVIAEIPGTMGSRAQAACWEISVSGCRDAATVAESLADAGINAYVEIGN